MLKCLNCEKEFVLNSHGRIAKYCSKRCKNSYYYRMLHPKLSQNKRLKIKIEIFRLLGNKCANPNCVIPRNKLDVRCLQIEHIKNNGNVERKRKGDYYRYILKQIRLGSKDYQLLCVYCNWLKRYKS